VKPLFIPAAIGAIRTRRDKTLSITVDTNELTPDQMTRLITEWANGIGVMAFKGQAFSHEEEQLLESLEIDAKEMGGKTPSQRLRNMLHVLWTKEPQGYSDFTTFYAAKMERICSQVKRLIEQAEEGI
jgi:hypothetical protein